jgi:DNA-binding beta-propeller fold protein YncE
MRVEARGIVQEVGFRPFIYHLAHQLRLAGFILNTAALTILLVATPLLQARKERVGQAELQAPAGDRPVKIDPSGDTVLPNGRLITPRGTHVKVAPHPYGMALSPDGKALVTANSGTAPFSVSIITELQSLQPTVVQIPPRFKSPDPDPESIYLGVAIAPDNRTLYASEGNNGCVGVWDLATHRRLASLSLDDDFQGKSYPHSLTADLKLSPEGRRLYVLDLAHFRLVILETVSKRIVSSIPVGRMPFALALSPDGRYAYVCNAGTYQYSLVPDYNPKDARGTGLDFPPFGVPSKEAQQGTTVSGKSIAGLGDPNVPESNSLWVVDVSDAAQPRITSKVKTGNLIGARSVGGSSPGAVVAGKKWIYVSNAAQDSITIIDASSNRLEKTTTLEPASTVRGLRGTLPFGLALGPGETRLYAACSGINAVAVLDALKGKVLGYIPTAWFPARVAVSRDGSVLYVANAKGFGAGPNGGSNFHAGPEGNYIGDITKGVVSLIPIPDSRGLKKGTMQVLRNNGFATPASLRASDSPIPRFGHASDKIHHVVFIVKENRTFDQVFGDLPEVGGERVEADSSLAEFGEDASVRASGKKDENKLGEKIEKGVPAKSAHSVEHARVTPNHHALARRFGISDNFYVDSDVSVDGHHWLVGNYPNELVESGWPAAYGGKLDFVADQDAPGRLAIGCSNPCPESYLEAGSLWEHLSRNHISFRNYGEGLEMAGDDESSGLEPTGVRESVNIPMPQVLFENTSRTYPTFNTNISDQYRFQQFEREFQIRYASGKEPLPQFMFIWLPNDHTADPRPEEGYPYRASYVADNDLALGRTVELFSHSSFWKDTAIFVTEDDAQDGVDHVDAHRSLLLVVSPYARRGVTHVHASMASILKTFDLLLGVPYLNQYDAAAIDLAAWFTSQPDFSSYQALPSDTRIFSPANVVETRLAVRAQGHKPSASFDDPATIRRSLRERDSEVQERGK